MIPHTCPKCNTPCLYALDLNQKVNCHSCGASFILSRFTKTERDAVIKMLDVVRAQTEALGTSRKPLFGLACVGGVFVVWLAFSLFGLIPDEWRAINRRFVNLSNEDSVSEAIGLVALGRSTPEGGIAFEHFFSAATISNDGYMITSKAVADAAMLYRVWVFIGTRRLEAIVIGADGIADFAIIKTANYMPLRFRLTSSASPVTKLNIDVLALGRQTLVDEKQSPAEWPVAVTRGTISRVYRDDLGTEWIEHSAALAPGSRGGPLIVNSRIVGLNVDSKGGIARAISLGPYRETIVRMIDEWKQRKDKEVSIAVP